MQTLEKSINFNMDYKYSSITTFRESLTEGEKEFIKSLKCKVWLNLLDNNFCCENEPNEAELEKIAILLRRVYHITKYKVWYCEPIKSWRVCYGF